MSMHIPKLNGNNSFLSKRQDNSQQRLVWLVDRANDLEPVRLLQG